MVVSFRQRQSSPAKPAKEMKVYNEATAAEFASSWKNSKEKFFRSKAKVRIEKAADDQEGLSILEKEKNPTASHHHMQAAMRLRLEAMTA